MDVVNWILGMLCKRLANNISPLLGEGKPQKCMHVQSTRPPETVDDNNNNTYYDYVEDRLIVCEVVK